MLEKLRSTIENILVAIPDARGNVQKDQDMS